LGIEALNEAEFLALLDRSGGPNPDEEKDSLVNERRG